MRKTTAVTFLTIAVLLSVSRADTRHWLQQKSSEIINTFRASSKTSNDIIYKWIDDKGVRHFSNIKPLGVDNVEAVPAEEYIVPSITLQEQTAPPVATSAVTSPSRKISTQTKPRKKKKQTVKIATDKVVLFTANSCGYCKQAVAFLRSHHIVFKEYNIERDKEAEKKMRAAGGVQHVPFAVIKGKKIRGFSEGSYRRALNLPASGGRSIRSQQRIRSTGRT
ncbi:MAG: glutaredoxin family protein [Candidatus Electrothrix sp. AR5]|nr:glutaredoxin family protein [Candidatus Electrothrix sp. AR5]